MAVYRVDPPIVAAWGISSQLGTVPTRGFMHGGHEGRKTHIHCERSEDSDSPSAASRNRNERMSMFAAPKPAIHICDEHSRYTRLVIDVGISVEIL